MSDIATITIPGGTHVRDAAIRLVLACVEAGGQPQRAMFNGVEMRAGDDDDADSIVAEWERRQQAKTRAYRSSPEGISAERARDEQRREMQARHDDLVARLPGIDWNSDSDILDWLCAFQPVSDHVGVKVDRAGVVAAFEERGFAANANTGAAYRPDDRENVFRYLVGQALDGLKSGPAIHAILLKFAEDWRSTFLRRGAK